MRGLLLFEEVHFLLLASQRVEKCTRLTRAYLALLFLLGGISRLGLLARLRGGLGRLLFVRALEFAFLLFAGRRRGSGGGLVFLVGGLRLFRLIAFV